MEEICVAHTLCIILQINHTFFGKFFIQFHVGDFVQINTRLKNKTYTVLLHKASVSSEPSAQFFTPSHVINLSMHV